MLVHNTLGRLLEEFVPRQEGKVAIYVCGPTVQSEPHVGHGRAAVVFDVIRRYLVWRGWQVSYVRNVTDIEDKIIAAAQESGVSTETLALQMAKRFADAYTALGVLEPDVEPKATDHVPEMLALIEQLVANGLAYEAGGDVYFAVRQLPGYGRLSGRSLDDLMAGARVEVNEQKRDPLDFALWKAAKPGEPWWDSPWGPGRPGWHIECSAMAANYLGDGFDIHGGGADLIFPHHENEIAQSEGASGKPFARYWLHNGMVNLGGEKMAKSTGHLVDLASVVERYSGVAVRMFYLRAHYRSPLEYSEALLEEAASAWDRLHRFIDRTADESEPPDQSTVDRFQAAMDNDFSTPEALEVLFDAVREGNRSLDVGATTAGLGSAVRLLTRVLGLESTATDLDDVAGALTDLAQDLNIAVAAHASAEQIAAALLEYREVARSRKDFAAADRLRADLANLGIIIEDTVDGVRLIRR